MAALFVLKATRADVEVGYYTGRAGQAWVGTDQVFKFGEAEAKRVAALYNSRSRLHGLTFEAVPA